VVVDGSAVSGLPVPNGNLLIPRSLVNENMSMCPRDNRTAMGNRPRVDWPAPQCRFQVRSAFAPVESGRPAVLDLSDLGQMTAKMAERLQGTISAQSLDYRAPLSGSPVAVRTFPDRGSRLLWPHRLP